MPQVRKRYPEGMLILAGGMLMLVSTALHPPLVDPYDLEKAFHEFQHAQFWMGDHILMLVAISCWLIGLAAGNNHIAKQSDASGLGAALMYVSLGMWILILSSELTILPILGNAAGLTQVWGAVFSFGLLSGYLAFACTWIGIFCYGLAIKRSETLFPAWFSTAAILSGLLAFTGIIVTCFHFEMGYITIPLTAGPAFIWTLWFGWRMAVR
ncbi:hypothetical protein [Heyndrickxia acidiproducens]|uniref:hypothetical protein n=1 Tax=Heyndrickxia acidiproducens TaxID=1121084 RepID=UPI0003807454|nr:hypothetical protein [Heyndrickxia acidiproducens]